MAYIYRIVNDINEKVYIGKTLTSVEQRFREHCRDSTKRRFEKRPLYEAMKKYGPEHFSVELIEETTKPEEREQYWIEFYRSYIGDSGSNGYNATRGGDGKSYLKHEEIIAVYAECGCMLDTAKKCNCSVDQVKVILKSNHIEIKNSTAVVTEKVGKPVYMIDKQSGEILKKFNALTEAARFLMAEQEEMKQSLWSVSNIIGRACRGRQKTAYGFLWRFVDESDIPNKGKFELKKVGQYNSNGELIQAFDSVQSAAEWLRDEGLASGEIKSTITSIRKSAINSGKKYLGYEWRYIDKSE